MFVKTNCDSITGRFLYSDSYGQPLEKDFRLSITNNGKVEKFDHNENLVEPLLNRVSKWPVVGIVAGIARFVVAIFHTLGHLFAAIINKGHLAHCLKGSTEMLRGLIEMIPVIGRIFSCMRGPSVLESQSNGYYASYFLVKVFNPKKIDDTDAVFALYKSHPFLSVPEKGEMEIIQVYPQGGPYTSRTNSFTEWTFHYKPHVSSGTIQRAYSHRTKRTVDSETYKKGLESSRGVRPPGAFGNGGCCS